MPNACSPKSILAVTHLHATWTGEGAAAHAEAHRRWTRGEAMMREALAQLKSAGATAHAQLHRRDGDESGHVVLSRRVTAAGRSADTSRHHGQSA